MTRLIWVVQVVVWFKKSYNITVFFYDKMLFRIYSNFRSLDLFPGQCWFSVLGCRDLLVSPDGLMLSVWQGMSQTRDSCIHSKMLPACLVKMNSQSHIHLHEVHSWNPSRIEKQSVSRVLGCNRSGHHRGQQGDSEGKDVCCASLSIGIQSLKLM